MPSISPVLQEQQIVENNVKDLCPNPSEIPQWATLPSAKYQNKDGGDFNTFGCVFSMLGTAADTISANGLENTTSVDYQTTEYTARSWEGIHPSEWSSAQVIEWLFHVFRQDYETVPICNFRSISGKALIQMDKSDLSKLVHEEHAEILSSELRQLTMQFDYMHSNHCIQNNMLSNNMYSCFDSCPDFSYNPHAMNDAYPADISQRIQSFNQPSCQQYAVEPSWFTSRSEIESDGESGHSTFTSSPYNEMQSKLADDPQKPHRRGPGRPPREGKKNKKNGQRNSRLWEFIRDLLKDKDTCPRLVKWEDRNEGVFRFVQSDQVAKLWGERKANPRMTYEKLSRAMRTYYHTNILEPVPKNGKYPKKLVYKFGPNATGWRN